jgi:2-keto-3-deoxy-L-rhamnonate aldolase RhmA
MVPMITSLDQLDRAIRAIDGKAQCMPLIETAYSMCHVAAIAAHEGVDALYIGLNDLHLSLGLEFLFEPLALGLVDWMAERITQHGKLFGFGGIAAMGSGQLPAEYILAEHIRMGSQYVILSSAFAKIVALDTPEHRSTRVRAALEAMRVHEAALIQRDAHQSHADRVRTNAMIHALTQEICNARKHSKGESIDG